MHLNPHLKAAHRQHLLQLRLQVPTTLQVLFLHLHISTHQVVPPLQLESSHQNLSPHLVRIHKFRHTIYIIENKFEEIRIHKQQGDFISIAVNGRWGGWTPFTGCSKSCKKTRKRMCNNPIPSYGGAKCMGGNGMTQLQHVKCNPNSCG